MSKKFSITEDEKKTIKDMYGLHSEQMSAVTHTTTKHVYTHEEIYTIKTTPKYFQYLKSNEIISRDADENGYYSVLKEFLAPNGIRYKTEVNGIPTKVKIALNQK